MSRLLEVENLKTYFQTEKEKVKAVDGIDFSINSGETIGIVGESGSGKSITALSIMGLVPKPGQVVEGSIHYYSELEQAVDLTEVDDKTFRKYRGKELGMIFQEPMSSLNPSLKCGEQVLEAIRLHLSLSKSKAKEMTFSLFEKVQLHDSKRIYEAFPHQLSGGQLQRVMIAMAISCNPKILIADEPTTALDVTVQKAILDLMNNLKKEINASIIFISHDLGVIAEVADRVLVMFQGKIVEQGTINEVFNYPKHPYTKGLLACRPPLSYRLDRLPVIADFLSDSGEEISTKEAQRIIENRIIDTKLIHTRLENLQQKTPILSVRNLNTWFPRSSNFYGKTIHYLKAVNDLSFDVYPGETMGLVGESGCGKTTLGRSILRLAPVRSGQIIFKGKDLMALNHNALKEVRKDLQIIFQNPYASLNPRMMIGHAVKEPMEFYGLFLNEQERKDRTIELLEKVGLQPEHYSRYPHEFSGGQRQRICIARALALEPQFLICDESVSALDVSVQAQVLNLLLDLREELELTYIFISHDLSVVKFMSDRMMVMNNGKIEEIGAADHIYECPEKDYTKKLIAAIPRGL